MTLRLSREEIDALADEIAQTSARIDAATHQLLSQIRTFDHAEGWGAQGALSCAHWLSWRAGISPGAAREQVRVARRLGDLPQMDDALRKGEVSYSKVRAMTRVATAENEEALLAMARSSTAAALERLCRLYRQVSQAEKPDPEVERDRRWVRTRKGDDGMVRITASLHPDVAAQTCGVAAQTCGVAAQTCGARDRADGLVALSEAALDDEAGSGRPQVEATVRVEVDTATLTGQLEDGTGVSAETARRLLCDAGVVSVAESESGTPLAVGRKKRTVSTALRRALRLRDKRCQFPGCSHERFLDAHHVHHWVDGGETTLGNTILLCRHHHRLVHEYGFSMKRREDGEMVFLDPDGRVVPEGGQRALWQEVAYERLCASLAEQGIAIESATNLPDWDGTRPDYAAAIDVLVHRDAL
jgi:hypothetical protein